MSSINNNTSAPFSLRQIMGVVEEEMDKLSVVSADTGKVAGAMGDTAVKTAENFKAALDKGISDNQQQMKVSNAFAILSAVLSGVAGGSAVGGCAAPTSAFAQTATVSHIIEAGVQSVAVPLAQAGGSVGEGVMAIKIGEDQKNQAELGAMNNVLGTTSGDAVSTVNEVMEERSSVTTNIRGMVRNEGEASLYQGS